MQRIFRNHLLCKNLSQSLTPPLQTPKCSGMRKPALVNMVSKLYGDGSSQQTAHKSPPSLKYLTERYIKQWPIAAVNVAYSQMMFPHALQVWEKENCFSGTWTLHVENGHSFTIPRWYAQPATMEGNNVQTIVDPHHIYVNNRTRCCSKGMSEMGIRANAWWEVAENKQQNQTGLSVELAVELRDRQRNEYAEPTFSEEVQLEMLRLRWDRVLRWGRVVCIDTQLVPFMWWSWSRCGTTGRMDAGHARTPA